MLGITKTSKTLSVLAGTAIIFAVSIAAAAAGAVKADINVRGNVTVNDQPAVSNSTVVAGSTISTGSDSGAIIGIGSNGRIELLPNTTVMVDYSDTNITALLTSGGIRISDAEGIGTTVTTPEAVIKADAGSSNSFSVNSSKSMAGSITKGKLTIVKAADKVNITVPSGKVVSLAAGESVVQDDDDDDDPGSGAWFIWALVLGGAAAGLIIAATQGNDIELGGGTTIVSPTS